MTNALPVQVFNPGASMETVRQPQRTAESSERVGRETGNDSLMAIPHCQQPRRITCSFPSFLLSFFQ